MRPPNDIILINRFPNYQAAGFSEPAHDRQFLHNNVIIRAQAKDVYYPEHWGPLSIKCCLAGTENYLVGSRFYSVNPGNFLVLNEGQNYSSYIHSKEKTSSFTISFSCDVVRQVAGTLAGADDEQLSRPNKTFPSPLFVERLHNKKKIAPFVGKLKRLSENGLQRKESIRETLYLLLEELIGIEQETAGEIKKVAALKSSTKLEIYRRLHYVKDYIDSRYQQEVTLEGLAKVAHLNSAYLLRQFRAFFSITPHQYLIKRRIDTAALLLRQTSSGIGEICAEVGYNDIASFGKLFNHFHRCSPTQYRSKFRKSANFFSGYK